MRFIEGWERFRGYDRWLPAMGTVRSTAMSRVGGGFAWQAVCEVVWQDQRGSEYAGTFKAFEESPLYQLSEGETLNIRIKPANPSDYYLPELIQSHLTRAWRFTLFTLMILLLLILALAYLLPLH